MSCGWKPGVHVGNRIGIDEELKLHLASYSDQLITDIKASSGHRCSELSENERKNNQLKYCTDLLVRHIPYTNSLYGGGGGISSCVPGLDSRQLVH